MQAKCSGCGKVFDIPDERSPMGEDKEFPCPECKGAAQPVSRTTSVRTGSLLSKRRQKERLTGEALKKKILNTVEDLPSMPQTVLKAREIMADPNSDFKELADLFETDQAVATRILKLANSSYYGLSGKVSSIKHASVVLGHNTLGELLTMGGTASLLGNRLEGYGLDAGALWKHSLAVAFSSRIIANMKDPELSNDAFTSGLIHDSGKLILDRYITEQWDLFEDVMADGQHTFLSAEKEILRLDHAEVASAVCKKWNIPQPMTVAIRYHHYPSRSRDNKLAYIVHVADAIAMMTGLGLGIDGTFYQMDDKALGFLGLQEEDVNDIMGEVLDAVQKISD
jgi:HD-like signal output (HDOD) protein